MRNRDTERHLETDRLETERLRQTGLRQRDTERQRETDRLDT